MYYPQVKEHDEVSHVGMLITQKQAEDVTVHQIGYLQSLLQKL